MSIMKLHALKCPNCDASIEIEDGIDTFFCKYCGYKIYLDGMSDASINAKVQIKGMAHQEKMKTMQYEQERYKITKKEQRKTKEANRNVIYTVAIVAAVIIFNVAVFGSMERKSIKEEQQLQATVQEIMADIESGNFDEAYVKANSLHYTAGWSDDIEKKWDETRKTLLKQIEQAEKDSEKKANEAEKGNSGGGFFDWFK